MVVHDGSMMPGFRPGDRLLVDPRPSRSPAAGDVVALKDPEAPGRLLLKRVVRVEGSPPSRFWVEGDAATASHDSRHFGWVDGPALVGLAWFRYAPEARRGRLVGSLK